MYPRILGVYKDVAVHVPVLWVIRHVSPEASEQSPVVLFDLFVVLGATSLVVHRETPHM